MLGTVLASHDQWDGPGHWWPVFPILWFILILVAVTVFTRSGRQRRSATHTGESRLAECFAAGEIDDTVYRERLAVLREKRR